MVATPLQPIRDRWALLVGVNTYIDSAFPRLNFCVRDVLALEQALTHLGYTVVCLHDELAQDSPRFPSRDNIEAELIALCHAIEPDDLLFVYFACHGQLLSKPEKQPVLVVDNSRRATLAKTGLPLSEIEALMRGSGAKRLLLMLDACHTGVEVGRDISDPEFIRNAYELAEGFALIAASTSQQVAQEWQAVQHGVFTYYLLEGLSGRADRSKKDFITVDDLKTHVLDGLRRWNVKQGGKIQDPTAKVEGLGDMIVADYRDRESLPPPTVEPQHRMGTGVGDRASTGNEVQFPSQQAQTMNNFQKQHLEKEHSDLQKNWELISEKLTRLRQAYAIETSVSVKFKLEHQIQEQENQLTAIENRLTEIEQALNSNGASSISPVSFGTNRPSDTLIPREFEPTRERRLKYLKEQLEDLISDEIKTRNQRRESLDEVERSRLDRRLERIYQETEAVEQEIKAIEGTSSS